MDEKGVRRIKKRLEDMEIVSIEDAGCWEDIDKCLDVIEEYEKEFPDDLCAEWISALKEARELGIVDFDAHAKTGKEMENNLESLKLAIKLQKEHGERIYNELAERRALSN